MDNQQTNVTVMDWLASQIVHDEEIVVTGRRCGGRKVPPIPPHLDLSNYRD